MSSYPKAHDSEACLLSSVMRGGGEVRQRAADTVRPQMFDRYEDLAAVVLSIATEGRPDPDTVRAEYTGPESDVEEVLEQRPAPQRIDRHIRSVQETYGKRELMDRALTAVEHAQNGHTFTEAATTLEEDLIDLTQRAGGTEVTDTSSLVGDVLKELEETQGQRVTGVETPFPKMNRYTRGWQDSDLIIPFGSTSMGKTAFALTCALHAAKNGTPVAIHTIEMSERALTKRLVQMECGVDLRQTTIPEEEWPRVTKAASRVADLPIYIEDSPALDPLTHRSRLRRLQYEHDVRFAVVDYLQIMQPPPSSDHDKKHHTVHENAQMLKGTAKILDIPIMTPSQTSKGVDKRKGQKRPTLADMREAGEEPPDVAIGLYRPEYYGITQWPDGGATEGEGVAIICKQRNGPIGETKLAYVGSRVRWEPLETRRSDDDAPF